MVVAGELERMEDEGWRMEDGGDVEWRMKYCDIREARGGKAGGYVW